jgi:hypothetical protein
MGLQWGDEGDDRDPDRGVTGHDPRDSAGGSQKPQGAWDALFGCGLTLLAVLIAGCALLGAVVTW